MKKEELVQLARIRAAQYELDPALVCAVCEQESAWNPWVSRYEPQFEIHKIYGPIVLREAREFIPQAKFFVNFVTEVKNRATSFGLMQVLGQVARERGFLGPIVELANPEVGLEYGCIQLKRKLEKANQNVQTALLRYNGGGDPFYPRNVLARMGGYQ